MPGLKKALTPKTPVYVRYEMHFEPKPNEFHAFHFNIASSGVVVPRPEALVLDLPQLRQEIKDTLLPLLQQNSSFRIEGHEYSESVREKLLFDFDYEEDLYRIERYCHNNDVECSSWDQDWTIEYVDYNQAIAWINRLPSELMNAFNENMPFSEVEDIITSLSANLLPS